MTLQDFLTTHGIDHRPGGTHRHVRHGWIGVSPCPGCGSTNYHAGVEIETGRAVCWRCGSLRLWDLLGGLAGIPWHEARDLLKSDLRGLASRLAAPKPRSDVLYPPGLQPMKRAHRAYLRERGFRPDTVESLWGVRATGPVGRLAWRLWIPIELDGEVVSWTTRAVGDRQPRYVSAGPDEESVNHKTLLYGDDLAGHSVVVVEGPLDAWAVGPGAVAVMGLIVSPRQVERIASRPVRAVCFDSTPDALRRAERLAVVLQQYPGDTHIIELETGDDPADADPGEIEELRRKFLSTE
jgi:hypothetical protein